jgi:osmoprotectant transport system ATP-binding protein
MIRFEGVEKLYGKFVALHQTDVVFPTGQTSVLIGSSGCGKSTMLRMILGLLEPTRGVIWVDNQKVQPANYLSLRRQAGYVIQEGGLFAHLTAGENASLVARHLKTDSAAVKRRLQELCELTHFPPEALGRYPVELSGGQRQRVSLMRAMMLEPKLLLLDEPLGALDPIVRVRLQVDLKKIFERLQQTILLVTHDLAEAAYFADEIFLLDQGRIVQSGSLDDLRNQPASPFVQEFVNAQTRGRI